MMPKKKLVYILLLMLALWIAALYSQEKKQNQAVSTISNPKPEIKVKQGETLSTDSTNPVSKDGTVKISSLEIEKPGESKPAELNVDLSIKILAICVSIVAVLFPLSSFILNWRYDRKIGKEFEIIKFKIEKRIGEIEKKFETDFKSKIERKLVAQISDYLAHKISGFLDPLDERSLQAQYVRMSFIGILANKQLQFLQSKDMKGFISVQLDMGKVELALAQVLSKDFIDIWNGFAVFLDLSKQYGAPQSLFKLIELLEKKNRFQDEYFQIKSIIDKIGQP